MSVAGLKPITGKVSECEKHILEITATVSNVENTNIEVQ